MMESLLVHEPSFPPLLRGEATAPGQDPFDKAVAMAELGADPGLILWAPDPGQLSAAVVLAPEDPLQRALTVVHAVALGLGDALGALAPPEVAVHYDWPDGIRVNGGRCGGIRVAASTADPAAVPDWLVIAVTLRFAAPDTDAPGTTPEDTTLEMEGCGELSPPALLESWSRHMLHWIHRWQEEGLAGLHPHWTKRAWAIGEPLPGDGVFMGLDEDGGRLVKTATGTRLDPLTRILEAT